MPSETVERPSKTAERENDGVTDTSETSSPEDTEDLTVADVPQWPRYELRRDGDLLGFLDYEVAAGGHRVFTHTEVQPGHQGAGLGGRLIRGALEDIRHLGLTVTSTCPFASRILDSDPDYRSGITPPPT